MWGAGDFFEMIKKCPIHPKFTKQSSSASYDDKTKPQNEKKKHIFDKIISHQLLVNI